MLRSQVKDPPPFISEVKRFEQGKEDKMSPMRGPGYYESADLSGFKPKPGEYFTSTKRFEHGSYLDQQKMKMIPGPGYYKPTDD